MTPLGFEKGPLGFNKGRQGFRKCPLGFRNGPLGLRRNSLVLERKGAQGCEKGTLGLRKVPQGVERPNKAQKRCTGARNQLPLENAQPCLEKLRTRSALFGKRVRKRSRLFELALLTKPSKNAFEKAFRRNLFRFTMLSFAPLHSP